jgi:hypothetical protein
VYPRGGRAFPEQRIESVNTYAIARRGGYKEFFSKLAVAQFADEFLIVAGGLPVASSRVCLSGGKAQLPDAPKWRGQTEASAERGWDMGRRARVTVPARRKCGIVYGRAKPRRLELGLTLPGEHEGSSGQNGRVG